jgi:hypothetical protein
MAMEIWREQHRIVLLRALARLEAAGRLCTAQRITIRPENARRLRDADAMVHDLIIRIKVELKNVEE